MKAFFTVFAILVVGVTAYLWHGFAQLGEQATLQKQKVAAQEAAAFQASHKGIDMNAVQSAGYYDARINKKRQLVVYLDPAKYEGINYRSPDTITVSTKGGGYKNLSASVGSKRADIIVLWEFNGNRYAWFVVNSDHSTETGIKPDPDDVDIAPLKR